jgi:hypothetical protein
MPLNSLNYLIIKAKQIEANDYKNDYEIFLIEPDGKKYVMHKVYFENPTIHIVSPPDFIEAKPKIDKP